MGAMGTDNHMCLISWIAIGVCQLVNKMEENTGKIKAFNQNDEQFLEAFVIFCGLGIQNTQMYEAVERAMAKQMVTLEVGRSPWDLVCPGTHSVSTPNTHSVKTPDSHDHVYMLI